MIDRERLETFYRAEAARYDASRYRTLYGRLYARLHHEALAAALDNIPRDARVLEVACGTGHVTGLLQALGFTVVACDLTPAMMEQARDRYAGRVPKIRFVRADATRLPFAATTFDLVVSTRFLHLFDSSGQTTVLGEMARVLRPGGRLLVDFDNWSSRWLFAVPYALYNLLRHRRLAPADTYYNRPAATANVLNRLGLETVRTVGLGGTHLAAIAAFNDDRALCAGRRHRSGALAVLAEQFLIEAVRR